MAKNIISRPVSNQLRSVALVAALGLSALTTQVQAETKCTDSRIGYANNLIFNSSAATQVAESGSAEALVKLEDAKRLYAEAEEEENKALCQSLVSQALTSMFQAVKMAKPEQASEVKHEVDFDNKEKSVVALLDALQYIMEESKDKKKFNELKKQTDELTAKAYALRKEGKVEDGMHVMEDAIVLLKTEVQAQREGVTLVRSLNFANPEEEYHYEIDRNDTHRMLVDVLLKEKREGSESINSKVNTYMKKADDLRKEADNAAGKKDFKDAIRLLEDSTKEIVRAIRSAGVYIPG